MTRSADAEPVLHLRALHLSLEIVGRLPAGWAPALSPLAGPPQSEPPLRCRVVQSPDGVEVIVPGAPVVVGDPETALGHLLDQVRILARGADHHVVLHAGALRRGDDVLVLPGISGSGKSTLAAHLLRSGWALLSDELVGLDADGRVAPCPLPLRLAPDACERLGLPRPVERPKADVPLSVLSGMPPAAGGRVTRVVFPYRRPGEEASLTAIDRSRAVALLTASVFAGAPPAGAFAALGAMTEGARCEQLTSGDPAGSARAIDATTEPAGGRAV